MPTDKRIRETLKFKAKQINENKIFIIYKMNI